MRQLRVIPLIDAPIVDIRRIHGARHIAHYVAKYVGKGPGKFGTCKRYWHTRDYVLDGPEKPPLDTSWNSIWVIVDEPLAGFSGTIVFPLFSGGTVGWVIVGPSVPTGVKIASAHVVISQSGD